MNEKQAKQQAQESTERITELMKQAATQVVPDNVNLWPEIESRLGPQVKARVPHWRGALTVAAAALIVITLGVILLALSRDDAANYGSGLTVTSLQAATPVPVATEDAGPEYAALCADYPTYCVPFGENYSGDSMLREVEARDNPRADAMLYNAAGVVRGISPEGVPFIGNPAAPTRFEVVMDFDCSHCLDYWQGDLRQFIADYVYSGQAVIQLRLGKVQPSYRFPGQVIEVEAQAAYCAGEQGAFWEMVDASVATRAAGGERLEFGSPVSEMFRPMTERLGLDFDAFSACMERNQYIDVITENDQVIRERSIEGVPTVQLRTIYGQWIPLDVRSSGSLAGFANSDHPYRFAQGMDAVLVEGAFPGGYVEVDGDLTRDDPQDVYVLNTELLSEDSWSLLTVRGGESVPHISMQSGWMDTGQPVTMTYTTSEGAVLFNWMYAPHDPGLVVDFPVQAVSVTGLGEYTLTIMPLGTPVDISLREQAIMLVPAGSMPVTFDVPETELVRLTIRVDESELGMDDALSSVYVPQPHVAVLAPHGETLGVFDPNRTELFELTFMPPVKGERFLILHPMETTMTDGFDGVPLLVSLEPVTAE